MGEARYDTIGHTYGRYRGTEPTWMAEIDDALAGAARVLNVGAGTGSYEELSGSVIALEPSQVMVEQRAPTAAPVVRGVAEHLPFADDSFDATLGVLTVHHWADRDAGLREVARVAERHVFALYQSMAAHGFWLLDYFPEIGDSELETNAPTASTLAGVLDVIDVRTLWIPRDCREGFAAAAWARPHEYLDPDRQRAISILALLAPEVRERGTTRLRDDLESGRWHHRYAELAELERADFGDRLVIARRR